MSDIKLKPEIKTRWLEALRSGDYTQGQNALRKQTPAGVQHCCLGVLVELALEDGIVKRRSDNTAAGTAIFVDKHSNLLIALPSSPAVVEWALESNPTGHEGAVSNLSVTTTDGNRDYLTGLNDSGRHTFADIADLIEEQL